MINDTARTILCYGDSNTWGNVPRSDDRHPRSVRWPGALQNLLGDSYEVISEGLCGRTLVAEDPAKPHRTGITHLQAIFESADPIDLAIVMLATNDIKVAYNLSAEQIADHLEQTITAIRNLEELEKTPEILIICPPPVIEPATKDLDPRMIRGAELFQKLPGLYKGVAEKNNCGYINAGDHISSSTIDGYHFSAEGHTKLAAVIANWIKEKKI